MTTAPALANRVPVFGLCSWDNPAPGVWEAAAKPATTDGRPPFEAVVLHNHTVGCDSFGWWRWELYQPLTDDPENHGNDGLGRIAAGTAPTLAEAQRQADTAARKWRDLQRHPLEVLS